MMTIGSVSRFLPKAAVAALVCAFGFFQANATEIYRDAQGVEWTYSVRHDGESIYIGNGNNSAISQDTAGEIAIPSEIDGLPVKYIETRAFYGCRLLTKITVPESVIYIGREVFRNCASLETVVWLCAKPAVNGDELYEYYDTPETLWSLVPDTGWENELDAGKWLRRTIRAASTPIVEVTLDAAGGACPVKKIRAVVDEKYGTIPTPTLFANTFEGWFTAPDGGDKVTSSTVVASSEPHVLYAHWTARANVWEDANGVRWIYSQIDGNTASIYNGTEAAIPSDTRGPVSVPTTICDGRYTVVRVGDYAFKDCSSITSVTIPEGVTQIGQQAFYQCSALESVEIPQSVATIGRQAFYYCSALQEVTIPDAVTEIRDYTFDGCTSLVRVDISTNVTRFGEAAFAMCTSLKSVVLPDKVETIANSLFNGCSALQEVTWPANLKTIGNWAFAETAFVDLAIPEGVTSVGENTFRKCGSITSVTIPDGVASLGSSAFYGCSSLASVEIPQSVATVGNYAFGSCSSLKVVTWRGSCPEAGSNLYESTPNDLLSVVPVTGWEDALAAGTWQNRRISCVAPNQALITFDPNGGACDTEMKIVEKDVAIGELPEATLTGYTFDGWFTEPDGGVKVGTATAFSDDATCYAHWTENAETVGGVKYKFRIVGGDAEIFDEVGKLAAIPKNTEGAIDIPPTLGGRDVTRIGDSSFRACDSITSVTIPDGVASIGNSAFRECYSLASVSIPRSVTSIGVAAFDGSPLKTIYVDSGDVDRVKELLSQAGIDSIINSIAFLETGDKLKVTFNANGGTCDPTSKIVDRDAAVGELPEAVRRGHSFDGWFTAKSGGTRVEETTVVSATVTYYAHWTENSETVGGVKYWFRVVDGEAEVSCDDYVAIEPSWFEGALEIPPTLGGYAVTRIGKCAFYGCRSVTSVTIPVGVTSIGVSAFYSCSSVTNVVIPVGVTNIGECAFYSCRALTGVAIPDGVTSIGTSAFDHCYSLTSVSIPRSVTGIGVAAFFGAPLKTIYVDSGDIDRVKALLGDAGIDSIINSIAFLETGDTLRVTFDANGGTCDQTSKVVDRGAAVGELPEATRRGYTFNGWFAEKSGGTKVEEATVVSATVTYYAQWTENAETVDGIKYRFRVVDGGAEIFNYNDTAIEPSWAEGALEIPSTLGGYLVTSIGSVAFFDCRNITSVTIPYGVTRIGESAFFRCSSITNVAIPDGVASIGRSAFEGCAFKSVFIPHSVTNIEVGAFHQVQLETVYVESGDADRVRDMLSDAGGIGDGGGVGGIDFIETGVIVKVTFDANGGTCDTKSRNVERDSLVGELPDAVRAGYTFNGWFTAKSGGAKVEEATVVAATVTYYAQWTENIETVNGIAYRFRIVDGDDAEVYNEINGNAAISRNTEGAVEIPPTLCGHAVTRIGASSFYECRSITSVTIPDGVTDIGNSAFRNCSSLESVSIPHSVTNIEVAAFTGDPLIKTVYVASGDADRVRGLLDKAGIGTILDSLEFLEIGATLTVTFDANGGTCDPTSKVVDRNAAVGELPEAARAGYTFNGWFTAASGGEKVEADTVVPATATYYAQWTENVETVDGIAYRFRIVDGDAAEIYNEIKGGAAISKDTAGAVEIPATLGGHVVTRIGNSSFEECRSMTSVTIPDGVTSIGNSAFRNCSSLASVSIPHSVTNVEVAAFSGAPIATIYVDSGDIDRVKGLLGKSGIGSTLPNIKFLETGNTVLVTFNANGGMCGTERKVVDRGAAVGELPKATLIGYAFDGWFTAASGGTKVEKTTIVSATVTYYAHWTEITPVEYDMNVVNGVLVSADAEGVANLVIPDNVTAIGAGAFAGLNGIRMVTIPSSVTSIGAGAFMNCTALEEIEISEGVERIGDRAFYGCKALQSVTIPGSVARVGDYAFARCTALESLVIAEGVKSIGWFAFAWCSALADVEIPESVEIGEGTFYGSQVNLEP